MYKITAYYGKLSGIESSVTLAAKDEPDVYIWEKINSGYYVKLETEEHTTIYKPIDENIEYLEDAIIENY